MTPPPRSPPPPDDRSPIERARDEAADRVDKEYDLLRRRIAEHRDSTPPSWRTVNAVSHVARLIADINRFLKDDR